MAKPKPKKPKRFPDSRLRIQFMRESGLFPEKLVQFEAKYGEMLKKAGY